MKPLCIDLFCGLGGWTDGFLAEGYDCIGFDIERHDYGTGGYPAQLVLQDVLTLDGSQFRDAAVIVASPPCQKYSYMSMPWSRAKHMRREYLNGTRSIQDLNACFDACFRIAREAGVPLLVENVRGAQEWVGRAGWNYGSFYLWGDIPALMPWTNKIQKHDPRGYQPNQGSWFNISMNDVRHGTAGVKVEHRKVVARAFNTTAEQRIDTFGWSKETPLRDCNSHSPRRKAASAHIARIPFPLARHIARCFQPIANTC